MRRNLIILECLRQLEHVSDANCFCLYNDLKWMNYFWVFCKIDKWINNWFNYLEKFCFSAFCCGKKINCASRSCRFFLIEQVCFIFRVNLHSCNRVSWSSLSAFNNRKWNTSGKWDYNVYTILFSLDNLWTHDNMIHDNATLHDGDSLLIY